MKHLIKMAFVLAVAGSWCVAQDIPVVDSWDVELTAPVDHPISIMRGETKYLRPRYLVNGSAATITNLTSVQLWYKPSSLSTATWFYVTNGVFLGTGIVQIAWTPACESTWSEYNYNIASVAPSGTSMSAAGKLTLRGTVTGSATAAPPGRVVYVSDSATYITNGGASINGSPIRNGSDTTVTVSSVAWTNLTGVPSVWSGTATDDVARAAIIVETNRSIKADAYVVGFSNAPVTWDTDFMVPAVTMPDGTVGQMFEEIYVTVRNTSGVTITNGKAVRATSANGFYSGATLASCTDTFDQVLGVIGLATMDITNGNTGKITLVGNVNDIDTTTFVEGSNLWLSATAGELTMTKPTAAGCNQILIGTCLRNNANVGRIGVSIRVVPLPSNIGAVATSDTNGWVVSSHASLATNAGGIGSGYYAMSNGNWAALSLNDAGISGATATNITASIMATGNAYSASFVTTSTNSLKLLQENNGAYGFLRGGTAIVSRLTSGLTGTQVTIVDASPTWNGPAEGTKFYQNPSNPLYYTNSPRTFALQIGSDAVTAWALDSVNGAGIPNGVQSFSSVLRESDFINFPCRVYPSGGIAAGQATFVLNGTNEFRVAYWEDVRTAFDSIGSGASAALDVETNLEAQLTGYVATNDARYLAALTNAAEFATASQGVSATNAQYRVSVIETNYASLSYASQAALAAYQDATNYSLIATTNEIAIHNTNILAHLNLASVVYVTNQLAGYVPTNDAKYIAALTNESDTLAAVLARGNNAAGLSATNFADVSGIGRQVFGTGLNVTNIDVTAVGSIQCGDNTGAQSIGGLSVGSSQRGQNDGTRTIDSGSAGASQNGHNDGIQTIGVIGYGAIQSGYNQGRMSIGDGAYGASQLGHVDGAASATNDGIGAMQILGLTVGQRALTTSDGAASILLGAGTSSNKNAIVAGDGQESHGDGSITAGGGFYGAVNATGGNVLTNGGPEAVAAARATNVFAITEDPSGFAGETDNSRTYSFDATQRVLTVSGASSVYRDGNLLTNFTTCTWPAIGTNSGIWYLYWSHATGTQVVSQTSWALDDIQQATVWWQGGTATVSTAPTVIIGEETHGFMPWSVHRRFHLVEGSVYASGLDLNVGPKSFTNSSGIWMDEDIQHSVSPTNTCRILARSGITAIRTQYCLTNGAGGADLMYDLNGTNTIVPTTGGGQYVNYWQYVVPGSVSDYMWVAGRTVAASTNSISTEAPYDLSSIMPFSEAVLLYRVTLRNSNPPTVAFTTDYRKSKVTGSSFAPSVHATLSGRDAADSHPLAAITSYETLATTDSVNFAAAPACYQVTLTNTSALSYTNTWSPTQTISRVTATSTGTVTFVMNWPANQIAYWGFCYDATGRPSTVFPAGAIYFTNGVYSSTAPSLGVSNYVSVMHSCASYQIMAFTNTLGTWGTP